MKDAIKLELWRKEPMSKYGLQNWSPSLRAKARKIVFAKKRITKLLVPVKLINTKEKLARFVGSLASNGTWRVMGWTKAKTKTGVKRVSLAEVFVKHSEFASDARITSLSFRNVSGRVVTRLSRYWFWKG